jgi:nitroreductase
MDVLAAIRGRRSIRRYQDEPVSVTHVTALIDAALSAPTGGNAQTWRFVVVQDADRVRRLRMASPGMPGPPPCVIAICQDVDLAERRGGRLGRERLALFDSAMAAQNILLAAHAVGLGACVVASFHGRAVKDSLELPAGVEPILLVTVGRPAEAPAAPARKGEEVVFHETYSGEGST